MINPVHVRALISKEFAQILADKSVLIVAFVIPLLLVVLYGTGMRMDIKPVSVAVVTPQIDDLVGREITMAMIGSSYFDVQAVSNEKDAKALMQRHEISAYVMIPNNVAQSAFHHPVQIMVVLNGSDAQSSSLARSYIESVIAGGTSIKGLSRQVTYLSSVNQRNIMTSGSAASAGIKDIQIISRSWFNESNQSTWYLMAGQIIGILTLMSAFMSSIVIAREFERGTMTGILATNATAAELLMSKIIPYYVLSIMGGVLATLAMFLLYDLPFRGSVLMFVLTMAIYLYVTVLIGLLISALTQNQFLSSEYAIILSFLPSILLSGALFDLRSIPAVISWVAHMLPPTYAVESSKICILSGGSLDILVRNAAILLLFAIIFTAGCYLAISRHFRRYWPCNLAGPAAPAQAPSGAGAAAAAAPAAAVAAGHAADAAAAVSDAASAAPGEHSQADSGEGR